MNAVADPCRFGKPGRDRTFWASPVRGGKLPLDLTSRNARLFVELAGKRDVKIFAGCDRPLGRDLVTSCACARQTGLMAPTLPEPTNVVGRGARG